MAEQKVTGHRILLRHRDMPDIGEFDVYTAQNGFETFKKVVTTMKPEEVKPSKSSPQRRPFMRNPAGRWVIAGSSPAHAIPPRPTLSRGMVYVWG